MMIRALVAPHDDLLNHLAGIVGETEAVEDLPAAWRAVTLFSVPHEALLIDGCVWLCAGAMDGLDLRCIVPPDSEVLASELRTCIPRGGRPVVETDGRALSALALYAEAVRQGDVAAADGALGALSDADSEWSLVELSLWLVWWLANGSVGRALDRAKLIALRPGCGR